MADFYIALKCINKNKYDGDMGLFSDHIINGTNKLWELIVKSTVNYLNETRGQHLSNFLNIINLIIKNLFFCQTYPNVC